MSQAVQDFKHNTNVLKLRESTIYSSDFLRYSETFIATTDLGHILIYDISKLNENCTYSKTLHSPSWPQYSMCILNQGESSLIFR
jgi:hypothetical protein